MMALFDNLLEEENLSWTTRYKLISPFEKYIGAIYFILTMLLTIGYGNIVPVTISEKLFCTLFMFSGIAIYGYIIGSLSVLFTKAHIIEHNFKKRKIFFNENVSKFKNNVHLKTEVEKFLKKFIWKKKTQFLFLMTCLF